METSSSSFSSSTATDSLLQALASRGWCFKDLDQVKALITGQLSSRGASCTVGSIESELVNMDLRSIGGKSLPDISHLRQAYHLQGPKVLQISSVRDISRSSMSESSGNSSKRRLFRFKLTDGNSEITAIEYSHIPSISDDVVPGTKVRLESKAVVHNGIVCLNAKITTVLGGLVQSLYEEWQMNQKYSGFTRPSLRSSQESTATCPPPFEKFQIGASLPQQSRSSQYSRSSSNSSGLAAGINENSMSGKINESQSQGFMEDSSKTVQPPASFENAEQRPSNSDARPKEVVESVPVQNQAAAQKLLQRMSHSNRDDHNFRGRRHRGKGKEEDSAVLTLDEWERRKSGISTSTTHNFSDVSRDEDLARQLQEKFDLEDIQVQKGSHEIEAENIRMSMFNFVRDDARAHGRAGLRGRGRGRGRRGGRIRG